MASSHFEQRVNAMQKLAAQYLPHLTSSEQTGLITFVDCLSQHYGANLLRLVLFVLKSVGISMISLTWMCWWLSVWQIMSTGSIGTRSRISLGR
jgi:hypothetical protein